MKKKIWVVFLCYMSMTITLIAQDVKELKQIESSEEFWKITDKVASTIEQDTTRAILILEEAFFKADNRFLKSALMLKLGELYIATNQFDKCMNKYESMLNDGISVFFVNRGNTYPRYTLPLENNERFISLLKWNNELVAKENENSSAEYYVQKPIDYDENKDYPLMMIFHGGIGAIQPQQHFWKSDKLKEEFVVVYAQGKNILCTGRRRFGRSGTIDVQNIFNKVKNDYSIDTNNVILGGPSAGGMLSIDIAINKYFPVKGLVLAFPVKPRAFGADEILEAGIKGLKINMICGENDWALERQKEMSVIFDKLNVKNRIVIYPGVGHDYPDDFSDQILKSLEFIGKDEAN